MIQRLFAKLTESKDTKTLSERDISVVATALLVEVINADHEQNEAELEALREYCKSSLSMSATDASALIDEAFETAKSSTSLWQHTDIVNKHMNAQEKYQLILAMWTIALSDNNLDRYEEHLIRKVSDLIYVPHSLFIKAKHEAHKI